MKSGGSRRPALMPGLMSSRHQALEALIVDRQDLAAVVAGWCQVTRVVHPGLDPAAGDLGPGTSPLLWW
jgi:hypothetical protein